MNVNAKEWHPPVAAVISTSIVSYSDNRNNKDDSVQHINGVNKSTANHKSRRRRQHQRTRQHRYGKKNTYEQCPNKDISSTSINNGIDTKEIYHNSSSTHTITTDNGMISPSTQDMHQSSSTQNHISKHREHQKHKQRRRRRRKGDKKKDDTIANVSCISSPADAGGGSHHHTQKEVANHRRRHHKTKVNGSATSEKHPR